MVDRPARDRLAAAIERYLAEDISAFEFDQCIWDAADKTTDTTVEQVASLLWHHYDDFKDHAAGLSRLEWDYFQRLLLLLRSGAALTTDRRSRWTRRQAIACAAIVVFVCGVFWLGIGWQLVQITLPLGVVSMLLSSWSTEDARAELDEHCVRLTPYASVAQMRAVHRTVPAFRKQRYPVAMRERRIRGPIAEALLLLPARVMWRVFSPVVLLFQAFPEDRSTSRVEPA